MKQKWLQMAARFDALIQRDRMLAAVGVLVGGYFCYAILVEPALTRESVQAKRIAQANSDLASVDSQLTEQSV